ncbi:MAG TPA: UDP-N-acetylmuramate--L-alanine ligase, partial [Syntrophorhabdales bacterium]|nr:UDP-N-acetylmuramate--L-alanine ligase [Syntrophorhabdales bacterium]
MFRKIEKIHFIGIGGIGMSGIAEVLLNLGFKVTGSDLRETETTERLASLGAEIFYGHKEDNVTQVDVVVVSSAVKSDNPEVKAAKSRFIPVIPRAEMLAELMRMKYSIAVAGAHGKTTTTSLVASILDAAGFDPTCVIGGRLNSLGTSAQLGGSEYLVAEADESDGSFLLLFPTLAVATNIDLEHLDFYKDIEEIKDAFVRFLNKVPFFGLVILCIDNPGLQSVIPLLKRRYITYGLSKQADLRAEVVKQEGFTTSFRVTYKGSELGEAVLATPGIHNVVNALAAIGVAIELDIPFSTVQEALRRFAGIHRRLELKWQNDWTLVDDYGHHPTEIKATLAAIRDIWKGRVVAAFQPHRYTRTKALLDEFVTSFNEADVLIVTDIYAASEEKIEGITGSMLAERISKSGHKNVLFAPTKDDVAETILRMVAPGDLVITLGAGDLYKIGERL